MDTKALFYACRTGDLPKLQFLVTVKEVDINIKDKWDSSPLFYACLCGHEEVVKYLLNNGARCQANTFDGERCMYGSLTNSIRNLIKNYKQVTAATMRRDAYAEFLRKLLESGMYSDLVFEVHGRPLAAHRCILAARSAFFNTMLQTRWRDRPVVRLKHKCMEYNAFRAVLCYLYTLRIEVSLEDFPAVILIAKHCEMHELVDELSDKMNHVISFQAAKPNVNVTMMSIEPQVDCTRIQDDLRVLAHNAVPVGLGVTDIKTLPFSGDENDQLHPDVIFSVDGRHFACHKAFFHCRSDYFRALEVDHFGEHAHSGGESDLPVIRLNGVSANVFMHVVQYIYTDACELNESNVYDVLYTGDLYLLPGLKRYCAQVIGRYIDVDNVVMVLRTARLFNLPRLEDECAAFIADNIDPVLQNEDFADFVREDAGSILKREESDSIPIIDDIRYHISTERVSSFSDLYEVDEDMSKIEQFLIDLGLDA